MLDSRKLLACRLLLVGLLVLVFAPVAHASYRAAFYYPWYPETWTVNGRPVSGADAAQVGDGFHPVAGFYSSADPALIDYHVRMLGHAGIDVAISSWWGPGSTTDERFGRLMTRTQAVGSPLRWTLYYEPEGSGNPTVAQLPSDLTYIRDTYAWRRMYARVNNKPVLFVYNADDTNCAMVDRWRQANQGLGFFLVLKVFPGFRHVRASPTAPGSPGAGTSTAPQSGPTASPVSRSRSAPGSGGPTSLPPARPRPDVRRQRAGDGRLG